MGNDIDIKGRQFDFLTALEYEPTATAGGAMWHCRCVCGKEILALGTSLRRGDKKSCGCRGKKKKEALCEYCGQPILMEGQRFCSQSCAAKARWGVKHVVVDESYEWEKAIGSLWKCRYQGHVMCSDRDCTNCGWNPEVAAARSAEIRRKLGCSGL